MARRRPAAVVALSATVASILPTFAHVAEDAAIGVPERFGLTPLSGGLIAGAAVALELALAVGCVGGRRAACPALLVVATGWALFAGIDHPGAFRSGLYRAGLESRLAVWAMVVLQAVTAAATATALRRTRLPGHSWDP